jgi:hydroxyacylglutathione hydrolase
MMRFTARRRTAPAAGGIQLIDREELKAKFDRGDDFWLVMTWNEEVYKAKHILGSTHIFSPERARELLDPEDEIVVYCTNEVCSASIIAYWFLVKNGFRNVRRYAGGLLDWEQAGYEMEGDGV